MKTLYDQSQHLADIERYFENFKSGSTTNFDSMQRELFQMYENNPVFSDSVKGKISVEGSLNELAEINKGVRKFLPWKKNETHNKRLHQLGEIIPEPTQLETRGILYPDNFLMVGLGTTGLIAGASYMFTKFLIPGFLENPSQEVMQNAKDYMGLESLFFTAIFVPTFGFGLSKERFHKIQTDEAKYIDGKIKEFYK